MDLDIVILSEVSQTERDKYHMISLIYGIWKKDADELIYKTETNWDLDNERTSGQQGEE